MGRPGAWHALRNLQRRGRKDAGMCAFGQGSKMGVVGGGGGEDIQRLVRSSKHTIAHRSTNPTHLHKCVTSSYIKINQRESLGTREPCVYPVHVSRGFWALRQNSVLSTHLPPQPTSETEPNASQQARLMALREISRWEPAFAAFTTAF
jgi:hypothetical protein